MDSPQEGKVVDIVEKRVLLILKAAALLLSIVLAFFVILNPNIVYRRTSELVLFVLVSAIPAVLFGAEAMSRWSFKMKGFVFTTTGMAAIFFGALFFLVNHSEKDDGQEVLVFKVIDEQGKVVRGLHQPKAVRVLTETVTHYVDGNTIILFIPKQVGLVMIEFEPEDGGAVYCGNVAFTGPQKPVYEFGKDFVRK